jgi:hypothetical protein
MQRRSIAFKRWTQAKNDFAYLHAAWIAFRLIDPLKQRLDCQVRWPDATQRINATHQDVIHARMQACAFNAQQVARLLHDQDTGTVTL